MKTPSYHFKLPPPVKAMLASMAQSKFRKEGKQTAMLIQIIEEAYKNYKK